MSRLFRFPIPYMNSWDFSAVFVYVQVISEWKPSRKNIIQQTCWFISVNNFFFTSLNALSFQSFCNAIVNFILALSYLYNWQLLQRHHCAFIWTQFGPTSGKPPFSLTQLTPPVGASVIGFLKKQTLCSYCTSRLSVTLT